LDFRRSDVQLVPADQRDQILLVVDQVGPRGVGLTYDSLVDRRCRLFLSANLVAWRSLQAWYPVPPRSDGVESPVGELSRKALLFHSTFR
jgi:hypothetical protein